MRGNFLLPIESLHSLSFVWSSRGLQWSQGIGCAGGGGGVLPASPISTHMHRDTCSYSRGHGLHRSGLRCPVPALTGPFRSSCLLFYFLTWVGGIGIFLRFPCLSGACRSQQRCLWLPFCPDTPFPHFSWGLATSQGLCVVNKVSSASGSLGVRWGIPTYLWYISPEALNITSFMGSTFYICKTRSFCQNTAEVLLE